MTTIQEEIPQAGTLVEVRGQSWVVGEEPLPGSEGSTLLILQSVEDGRYGDSLPVIWEVEPGRRILPRRSLPEVTGDGFDLPERLAAFLDAVRWSAVTSAEVNALEPDVEVEQVADVFVRINSEGVTLNYADFIPTLMSVFWEKGRAELEEFARACTTPSVSGPPHSTGSFSRSPTS